MSTRAQVVETRRPGSSEVESGSILRAGLLAVAAAVVANLLVRALLLAVLDIPVEFPPFQAGAIAFMTALGVGLGAVMFWLISRKARQPIPTFRVAAVIALIISILPNFAMMANPAAMPFPGGSALGFGALIIFHLVAGAIAIYMLTTLTRAAPVGRQV